MHLNCLYSSPQQPASIAQNQISDNLKHDEGKEDCTILDMTGDFNALSSLSPILCEPYLSHLKILRLSHIRISNLSEELGTLSALEELYLNRCALRTLPATLDDLSQLKILDLSRNNLERFAGWKEGSYHPFCLQKLSRLHKLDLSHNYLTKLPARIGKLSALIFINLEDNQLDTLPNSFGNLTNLRTLNLSCNRLKDIPFPLRSLRKLRILKIAQQQIRIIPPWISDFEHLTELELSPLRADKPFQMELLEIPSSLTIQLCRSVFSRAVLKALSKVYNSNDYSGPVIQGLKIKRNKPKISYQEARNRLKVTLDLETWLHKHSLKNREKGLNIAYGIILKWLNNPQQTRLDLGWVLRKQSSFPPIFQEPFTSKLKELFLSNNNISIPVEIAQFSALKKLDIKGNKLLPKLVAAIEKALSIGSEKGHTALKLILEVNQWTNTQTIIDTNLPILDPLLEFIYDEQSTVLNLSKLLSLYSSFPPIFQEPFLSRLETLILRENGKFLTARYFSSYDTFFNTQIHLFKALKKVDLCNNNQHLRNLKEGKFNHPSIQLIWE